MLLLQPDAIVARADIVDAVWGEDPPNTVVNVIQSYVGRLRRILEPARSSRSTGGVLGTEGTGYLLRTAGCEHDLVRFRQLAAASRRAASEARTVELACAALRLWRGRCLVDLDFQLPAARSVEEERVELAVAVADVARRTGRSGQLLPHLRLMAAAEPLNEVLQAELVLTLAAVGNQAEALRLLETVRHRLREELGVDPGARLREAQQQVLRQDVGPTPAPAPAPRPAELPPDVAAFTGRAAELDRLVALLASRPDGVVIAAIDGAGGIGKSALALRAGHAVADRFPDGKLYVNLQGSTPGVIPTAPIEVLDRFLRTLGVPPSDIPSDVEGAAARFRTATADRRMLVVLDNARDVAQVRPLLPGGPCAALVTSRRVLATLDSATHVHLGVLPPEEALALFTRLVGADRAAGSAAADVVRACGRLPLAVRVAAARLIARPDWTVAVLADRLADTERRLGELRAGDLGVEPSLRLSYDELAEHHPPAARMFRLLGTLDTHDVTPPVAGALADLPTEEAEQTLEHLVDARLLDAPQHRYRMHDLIRLLARTLAAEHEPQVDRSAALRRTVECYLATARTVVGQVDPAWSRRGLHEPKLDRPGVPLPGVTEVIGWLDAERDNLVAVTDQAAIIAPDLAVAMATVLSVPLDRRAHWNQLLSVARIAARSARSARDDYGFAQAHHDLGRAYYRHGELSRARRELEQALVLWRSLDYPVEEAWTLTATGIVCCSEGDYVHAETLLRKALRLFRRIPDLRGMATCQSNIGFSYLKQARYPAAIAVLRKAAAGFRAIGDVPHQASVLVNLGEACRCAGSPRRAIRVLGQAIDASRKAGVRYEEAEALWRHGYALRDVGDAGRARESWQGALLVLRNAGLTTAAEAQLLLDQDIPDLPQAIRRTQ